MPTEQTPLLWNGNFARTQEIGDDVHAQFCSLTGCPPSNAPSGYKHHVNDKSIYGRARAGLKSQQNTYYFTAALTNTLLLSQVVLGAALTALGAAKVPYVMVTVFGAVNTIIAGLVAYLKSRGQPMRSRMYRDDLERVVDEIENSEVMWLGISQGVNGYGDLTDGKDRVTVRDEVARLTRLYDRAVRTNNLNNPDLYSAGGADSSGANKPAGASAPQPTSKPKEPADPSPTGTGGEAAAAPQGSTPPPAAPAPDPDQSPASAPPVKKPDDAVVDTRPVATDTDKGQPAAAAREGDLGKNKDKESTSGSDADPSCTSPLSASDDNPRSQPSSKPSDGDNPGTAPPPGVIAPPDAPPNTAAVAPLSVADVDQSPATRPRVSGRASAQKDGASGSGQQGVARKVAGDSE